MSHIINGFIASFSDLSAAVTELKSVRICRLSSGMGFFAVPDEMVESDEAAASVRGFDNFTDRLEKWAVAVSKHFPIAYIETEYFGGVGTQSAALWDAGKLTIGPLSFGPVSNLPVGPRLDWPINKVLRGLGVNHGAQIDEFAALGLGRYRSNEDWLKSGQ